MLPRLPLSAAVVALLALPVLARADDTGVEVLARGPVHEAFAQPVEAQPQAPPVLPKEPPVPIEEQPPDQKPEGDNAQWVPGYWQWDEDASGFVWVSGFWRVPPPGRQWVAGYWRKTDGGWQWVPGVWLPADQSEMSVQPPPPEVNDPGPSTAAPSGDSFYVPGCWVYRETRYLWRPGYWLAVRPGWVWVPAHYLWTPAGYVFVSGYWDYPLGSRGVLFAPVLPDPAVCFRAGWSYTPDYVVSVGFLPGALFVRPRWGHYYFGDYFGARYARAGFAPWVDYRVGKYAYDPLFSYYRARYADRGWDRDLRALYAGRAAGEATLPARTLVQQNTLIRDLRAKNVSVTSIRNVTAVTPLGQLGKSGPSLVRIGNTERTRFARSAGQVRALSVQRRDGEANLLKSNGALRPTDRPRPLKLDLPRTTAPTIRTDPGRPAGPTTRETPRTVPDPRPTPRPDASRPTGPTNRDTPHPTPRVTPPPKPPADPRHDSGPGPRGGRPNDPGPGGPRPPPAKPPADPRHDNGPGPRSPTSPRPRTEKAAPPKRQVASGPRVNTPAASPRPQPRQTPRAQTPSAPRPQGFSAYRGPAPRASAPRPSGPPRISASKPAGKSAKKRR